MFRTLLACACCLGLARAADPAPAGFEFDGKTMNGLVVRGDTAKSKWALGSAELTDGKFVFEPGKGTLVNTAGHGTDIYTEQKFGDCVVDVEFMIPKGSNSGVYLMGEYEIQVIDSFGKKDADLKPGDMGGIYITAAPKTNACKPAGEWQTFHIEFLAPKFDAAGKKTANAKFVKVLLNGTLIHENVEAPKPTGSHLSNTETPTGPLLIQGDHGIIALRKIVVKPMK